MFCFLNGETEKADHSGLTDCGMVTCVLRKHNDRLVETVQFRLSLGQEEMEQKREHEIGKRRKQTPGHFNYARVFVCFFCWLVYCFCVWRGERGPGIWIF